MNLTPCPPPILTRQAALAVALHFVNVTADPNPQADWPTYDEAAKLQPYPSGSEWGLMHERLSGRYLKPTEEDPSHGAMYYLPEWHRLTVHATMAPNGTTLTIEIKLETAFPNPATGEPGTYSTAFQATDVLQLPIEANWGAAQWEGTTDPNRPAQCRITLGPLGRPNRQYK